MHTFAPSRFRARNGARLRSFTILIVIAFTAAALSGCARIAAMPEITPNRYAPPSPDHNWTPPPTEENYLPPPLATIAPAAAAAESPEAGSAELAANSGASAESVAGPSGLLSLAGLVDLALRTNPETRRDWETARAQAAAYGAARAAYYPHASTETDAGYNRILFQVAPGPAVIRQWQVSPSVDFQYTLIDFGRRRADADYARQRLAAANFIFNRRIQDVVFGVERAFYALSAAEAAVIAAEQNAALAHTDLDAVSDRVRLGLATEPALLLSRERNAQAEFELESARTIVNDAHAAIAVAVGVAANQPLEVENLQHLAIPKSLGQSVDTLIHDAILERPDLAAEVARMRQSEATQNRAHAEWFPQIGVDANYGQENWWYNYNNVPVINSSQPQYQGLVELKWDIFTGFARLNDDRRTAADRAAERESVRALEIATIADVWRTYFDFQDALKRYQYALALIAAANESYSANLDTYRQGLSTIVELLTADRDLAAARFTIIQSTADLLTASAAVAYAVGSIEPPAPSH